MNRIVLEQKPRRPQLPVYTEIDNEAIRGAAAAWDSAKVAADEAKKTCVQLEQELPNAQAEDARADEQLRATGQPKLKGRPATTTAEKAIANAQHEQRVCELAEQRAFDELQAALDEHQDEWAESIEKDTRALDDEWTDLIGQATKLHAQRSSALAVRRLVVGGGRRSDATVGFEPTQIQGIELATSTHKQTGYVAAGDVLALLADLGMPEPVAEVEPVRHPHLQGNSPNRGQGPVESEVAERRAFDERAQSVEGERERERTVAERQARHRERAERNERAREEAEQTVAG